MFFLFVLQNNGRIKVRYQCHIFRFGNIHGGADPPCKLSVVGGERLVYWSGHKKIMPIYVFMYLVILIWAFIFCACAQDPPTTDGLHEQHWANISFDIFSNVRFFSELYVL